MNHPTPAAPADPVLSCIAALLLVAAAVCWSCWQIARLLFVPVLALLLVALGWRPAPRAAAPQPVAAAPIAAPDVPAPVAIAVPPLDRLPVAELRRLARAAGLPRSLTRSGRRAALLEALAAA
jgi:hypothetical protein